MRKISLTETIQLNTTPRNEGRKSADELRKNDKPTFNNCQTEAAGYFEQSKTANAEVTQTLFDIIKPEVHQQILLEQSST